MPYMLQPKSYVQIARPNLYNVAYRRVGAYKGMGRLHPTNYLEIGVRPNRIGATSGQYNTASGQLSLLPPSLRGLGQTDSVDLISSGGFITPSGTAIPGILGPFQSLPNVPYPDPNLAYSQPAAPAAPGVPPKSLAAWAATVPTWVPWLIGGGFLLVVLFARRR